MTLFRTTAAIVTMALLSACGMPHVATRNAPFEALPPMQAAPIAPLPVAHIPEGQAATEQAALALPDETTLQNAPRPAFHVVNYSIVVPEELTVSEANLYYPIADIVWRGDAIGDRKDQIGYMFQESLNRARADISEGRAVKAEITVRRFHSITEKTRYTVGGVHSINFDLTMRDAQTNEVLATSEIRADLKALGGRRAINADRQGLTMKERIQSHLARVLRAEMTVPGGWSDQGVRLAKAIDQI